MAEDSSSVLLEENLNRCFAEQITTQFEGLEENLEKLDCSLYELGANQEEDRGKIERLKKRVAELETDFGKTDLLEERVAVLKVQNIELRDHLNLTIDMLNNVTTVVNNLIDSKEPTDDDMQGEATTPHEENPDGEQSMGEDTQPTLAQVYAMYLSQPLNEEGWDEMTAAIEAAEEYEAKKVDGLTANERQELQLK